jgi:hypothetical protein
MNRVPSLMLSLLSFFSNFRGTPHQLAAIKELEDSIPPEHLSRDALWFQTWKTSGISRGTDVPYVHQLNFRNDGYRRCLDASAAMVAMMYGVVSSAEEYGVLRASFGNTTDVIAHVKTLRSLGLHAQFINDADGTVIEAEIQAHRVVLVGFLHHGDFSRGEPPMCDNYGCGHWAVATGYEGSDFYVLNDPMGAPSMEKGGHATRYGGHAVRVSRQTFDMRWQVEGPSSGWAILVDNE